MHRGFNSLLLILAIALIVLGGGYYASTHSTSVSMTGDPQSLTVSTVAWRSVIGARPIKSVQGDGLNDTNVYQVFDIGTFTGGPYTGDHIFIAIVDATGLGNTYPGGKGVANATYFVGDVVAKPIAWYSADASDDANDVLHPLGLLGAGVIKLSYALLPPQLAITNYAALGNTSTRDSQGNLVSVYNLDSFLAKPTRSADMVPGITVHGDPVLRIPDTNRSLPGSGVYAQYNRYYVQTPYGAVAELRLLPNFFSQQDTVSGAPEINWTSDERAVAPYTNVGTEREDCFDIFTTSSEFTAALIQTGTTVRGDPIFEVNPQGHDVIYQCLYREAEYDLKGETYTQFIQGHQAFFWKHPYGDWLGFVRSGNPSSA